LDARRKAPCGACAAEDASDTTSVLDDRGLAFVWGVSARGAVTASTICTASTLPSELMCSDVCADIVPLTMENLRLHDSRCFSDGDDDGLCEGEPLLLSVDESCDDGHSSVASVASGENRISDLSPSLPPRLSALTLTQENLALHDSVFGSGPLPSLAAQQSEPSCFYADPSDLMQPDALF